MVAGPEADGTCAGRCFSDERPLRGCWEGKGHLVEESQFCEESGVRRFKVLCRALETAAAYPESRAVGQKFTCRTFLRAVDCFRRFTEVP